jgi:hypothetical protein
MLIMTMIGLGNLFPSPFRLGLSSMKAESEDSTRRPVAKLRHYSGPLGKCSSFYGQKHTGGRLPVLVTRLPSGSLNGQVTVTLAGRCVSLCSDHIVIR